MELKSNYQSSGDRELIEWISEDTVDPVCTEFCFVSGWNWKKSLSESLSVTSTLVLYLQVRLEPGANVIKQYSGKLLW